jgi:hypothetical protein
VFLHAGTQGVALFKRLDDGPAGGDLNHLALNVADGTYESLKAELEAHGVAVSGRPGDDQCIYFSDPTATGFSRSSENKDASPAVG